MVFWPIVAAAAASTVQPGSTVDNDLHCLAAFALVLDSAPEDKKTGLMIITSFYLGRIDAGAPDLDLEEALVAVLAAPDYKTKGLSADLERCGKEMQIKGAALKKVGSALVKRGGGK